LTTELQYRIKNTLAIVAAIANQTMRGDNESGGPTVAKPSPNQRGFGSRLIQQMLNENFTGKLTTSYRKSGNKCQMIAPLSNIQRSQH
jgi:two-component sensor histidine kinase